jgi:hypothetical protein
VRKRDAATKKVITLETRYETEGEAANSSGELEGVAAATLASLEPPEGVDDLSSLMASQGTSFGRSFDDNDNPYAWAQRLREIPDKVRAAVEYHVTCCGTTTFEIPEGPWGVL